MINQHYYAVWRGREPGVYSTWTSCLLQIKGLENPLFKRFEHKKDAEKAVKEAANKYFDLDESLKDLINQDYISVNSSYSAERNEVRFWAFDNLAMKLLFKSPSYSNCDPDVTSFLAIIQTLEYLRVNEDIRPIRCNNKIAVDWVKNAKSVDLENMIVDQKTILSNKIRKALLLSKSTFYVNEIISD